MKNDERKGEMENEEPSSFNILHSSFPGERQGVSPPSPSRLRTTSELESQNSGKRTHAVHHSSRGSENNFNVSRPLPARLAGTQVLPLTIASPRRSLPCPARLAGSRVSSLYGRMHATNFPIRSDKPTGAAFGLVSSSNQKTFAHARQAGTGRTLQSNNNERSLSKPTSERKISQCFSQRLWDQHPANSSP